MCDKKIEFRWYFPAKRVKLKIAFIFHYLVRISMPSRFTDSHVFGLEMEEERLLC